MWMKKSCPVRQILRDICLKAAEEEEEGRKGR